MNSSLALHAAVAHPSTRPHARGPLQRVADPLDLQSPWAAILYITGDFYIFYIIHMICHKYFTVAIEMVVEITRMNEDLAGATLMAIGTSFPELLSGIVGVFVPGAGDAGLGTVVGSLVFNLLVINGGCVLVFEDEYLQLSRLGAIRDVFFQALVIIVMVWAFWSNPTIIDELRAYVFIAFYVMYTVACWKGGHILSWFRRRFASRTADERELDVELVSTEAFQDVSQEGESVENPGIPFEAIEIEGSDDQSVHEDQGSLLRCRPAATTLDRAKWILLLPVGIAELLCTISIPDCHSPCWQRCLKTGMTLCLFSSVLWLSILVFFMMEWAMKAGELVKVDSTVMGLTVCAIGTSLPDCMCSLIVARKGKGEMAISNVFGSNVFDILVGLGVPWALKLIVSGSVPPIEAESFEQSAWIIGSILAVYATIVLSNKYRLPRWSGYLYLGAYAVYLVFVVTTQ